MPQTMLAALSNIRTVEEMIIAATGMRACRDILDRLFMTDPNVKRFDTHFVFDAVKTGLTLPTAGTSQGG